MHRPGVPKQSPPKPGGKQDPCTEPEKEADPGRRRTEQPRSEPHSWTHLSFSAGLEGGRTTMVGRVTVSEGTKSSTLGLTVGKMPKSWSNLGGLKISEKKVLIFFFFC